MGAAAGALRGGSWGARLGAFLGPPGAIGGAIAGAIIGGTIGYFGTEAIVNQMSGADEEAESLGTEEEAESGATTEPCIGCDGPRDPCRNLRRRLQEHEQKLSEYRANPQAHDHLGILGHSPERDASIIEGRIRHLQNEIRTFRDQLRACEAQNGTS